MKTAEKPYRVYFARNHVRYEEYFSLDVMAQNAKSACELVLERYYHPYKTHKAERGFYPYHRTAKKLTPEEVFIPLRISLTKTEFWEVVKK